MYQTDFYQKDVNKERMDKIELTVWMQNYVMFEPGTFLIITAVFTVLGGWV